MKVLVAVASRHGSTREIADAIADTLRGGGHHVDVDDPDEVGDLEAYDAVVLGSAVYVGRWAPSARAFVDRLAASRERPVWLFSSGPVGRRPVAADDPEDVPSVVARLRARGHRTFGGRLDPACLSIAERAVVALLRARPGDDRVWSEITDWAHEVGRELHAAELGVARRGPLRRV